MVRADGEVKPGDADTVALEQVFGKGGARVVPSAVQRQQPFRFAGQPEPVRFEQNPGQGGIVQFFRAAAGRCHQVVVKGEVFDGGAQLFDLFRIELIREQALEHPAGGPGSRHEAGEALPVAGERPAEPDGGGIAEAGDAVVDRAGSCNRQEGVAPA